MLSWRDLSLKYKILSPFLLVLVFFTLFFLFYFLPTMKERLIEEKRHKIKNIIQATHSHLQSLQQKVEQGVYTQAQAQNLAKELVRGLRYGPENNDYVWINNYEPRMVMHPFVAKLNGQSLKDYQDKKGNLMFVRMTEIAKSRGSGFLTYYWQYKDQKDKIVPKISYIKAFEPWNWILGTGVYIQDIEEEFHLIYLEAVGLFALLTLLFVLLVLWLVAKILKPIRENVRLAQNMAQGDLTTEVARPDGDEIGRLSQSMTHMQKQIRDMLQQIIHNTEELRKAAEEINDTAFQLSETSQEQASNMEEISSTMEELGSGVSQNAQNAQKTNSIAQDSSQNAEKSEQTVQQTVAVIQEISEKIQLVDDIAQQTNLLALNASIEAARAGDSGKGFAVVAEEVKKLAQNSQNAASQIMELADKNVTIVNQAGDMLKSLAPEIGQTAELVDKITKASQEQDTGINQINQSLNQINEGAQSSASSSEELSSTASRLKEHAGRLSEMVDYFKVS
jgi:methyl-accepting chemotaxis protein